MQASEQPLQNPVISVNNIIGQILGSANPQAVFNQIVANNPEAKKAMDIINQYGNGDPRAGFMNYASATGKQSMSQTILQQFGLK